MEVGLEPHKTSLSSLPVQDASALLALGKYIADALIVVDGLGNIAYVNPAAQALFNCVPSNVVGRPLSLLVTGQVDGVNKNRNDACTLSNAHGHHADGSLLTLDGTVVRLASSTGPMFAYLLHDGTASRRAEDSSKLAELVYRNTSEGMLVIDSKGMMLDVNPAFVRLRGYIASEAIGRHIRMLNSSRHDRAFYTEIWRAVMATGSWQGEHIGQHKDGNTYPEWLSINTIFNEDGSVFRRIMIFSNISEIKQAEAIIWNQANFDFLTELPNRQMFYDRLEQSIHKAQRNNTKLALMFLDLDRFKQINDTLGHAMGDTLLKQAARRLNFCVRQSDTVARLGGDEFTVLLNDVSMPRNAERVARSILKKMTEPFILGTETVFISTSIGITLYPEDGTTSEALLNNADQAMYVAKNRGRNRYSYFTPSMQEEAQTRMRLVNDLHVALENKQLSLVYQPIVDLKTGKVIKAEALMRWEHPVLGDVPPSQFIPLAEETGLISVLGHWAFCEAARQVQQWRSVYMADLQISVNTSPVQFRNEGISLVSWLSHLHGLGLSGEGVIIEITEGMLLDASSDISDQLNAIRSAGMQVSLDDFGTGYSSLSYLHKFNIDYLKIDQSFIRNLESAADDLALCETVIIMGHKLGLKVVAEGVETARQQQILIDAGCDYGQGYLFSHPIPALEFETYLRNQLN